MLIVKKFGGTSLGNSKRMINIAKILIEEFKKQRKIIVVVSAISPYKKATGITNMLLEAATKHKMIKLEESNKIDIQKLEKHVNEKNFELINDIKNIHFKIINESIQNSNIKNDVKQKIENRLKELLKILSALTIIKELPYTLLDKILSVGEEFSGTILSSILNDMKFNSIYLNLSHITPLKNQILTPEFYKNLEFNIKEKILQKINHKKHIPIIGGFIGQIPGGIIKNIGRGYTDYTSALIATSIKSTELQIWKEIDGMFTADPQLIKNAKVLHNITPEEAFELSYFGSEVIHPHAMDRLVKEKIPVRIKNTFKPEIKGTLISEMENLSSYKKITGITIKKNIIVLNIHSNKMLMAYGFLAKVFHIFEKYKIIIDIISTSEVSISLTLATQDFPEDLIKELEKLSNISIIKNRVIISIIGQCIKHNINIQAQMFNCLAKENINIDMISQGASKINISCVIKEKEVNKALTSLHKCFINN